jgi:cell division protein ZapA
MSEIVLTIGGRDYTMACADGEEAHIAELGALLHDKLSTLPGGAGQSGSRSLLFAALLLADELYELRKAVAARPQAGISPLPSVMAPPEELAALAERLETLADALDPGNGGEKPAIPLHP